MKKLFILFAVTAAGLMLKADVMYWQLGTPGSTTYNGQEWNTVRVGRVTTGPATPIMSGYDYLKLTPTTNPNESLGSDYVGGTSAANGYFAVLPDNASSYSYFIELGNYNGTTYSALAQSGAITYSELLNQSYVITTEQLEDILGHMSTVTMQAWVGGSYQAVPEPTGGLMVLVGLSVLALRRRKARV